VAAYAERIVLVGLPGAGKSTVGPILALQIGWRFIDLDQAIEAEAGLSVPHIFKEHGEAEFRRLERELTARLASEPLLVLSVGGGWMVYNRLPGALIVWLQVSPDVASMRICEGAHGRPLLQPDPALRLKQLHAEREAHYRQADIHIDTDGKTAVEVANAVATAVEREHGN